MQIPRYWAQARLRQETSKTHGATVQRWGWSDISQAEAEAHAQQRAQQALDDVLKAPVQRHLAPDFERMEWANEYSLFAPTPIREEILEQRGETVMTRNSYGAHCLNTDKVAIADLDYPRESDAPGFPWIVLLILLSALPWLWIEPISWNGHQIALIFIIACMGLLFRARLKRWYSARQAKQQSPSTAADRAMARVLQVQARYPDWGLRLYQTPKGLRIIVTHASWDWQAPQVQALFQEMGVDPVYALLCEKQQCFRARVTGKPWRMGMSGLSTQERHWPVKPQHQPGRHEWSQYYDEEAQQFAACRFLQQLGPSTFCAEAQAFVLWHDSASKALTQLPLA